MSKIKKEVLKKWPTKRKVERRRNPKQRRSSDAK